MNPTPRPARWTLSSTTELLAHPAVRMWQILRPRGPEPVQLEAIWDVRHNGEEYKSLVYRLVGVGAGGASVIAKRCPRATGAVERNIYEKMLARISVPTPRYYGAVEDGDRCWLFLDDVEGERYSLLVAEHRALAAEWLAAMHVAAAEVTAGIALPDSGPARYLEHLRSARARIRESVDTSDLRRDDLVELEALLSQLDHVESRWAEVEACCSGLPRTLVHGDFVGKNLRVHAGPNGRFVLAFDWEHAGWAVPAADLAQAALHGSGLPGSRPRWVCGGPASPDLTIYAAVVRRRWPQLDSLTLERLASCGIVYRCLAALEWEAHNLHKLCDFSYAAVLSDAMRGLA